MWGWDRGMLVGSGDQAGERAKVSLRGCMETLRRSGRNGETAEVSCVGKHQRDAGEGKRTVHVGTFASL